MFLRTENGIVETPKFKRLHSLFCKNLNLITGEHCSKNGMRRISGADNYAVCARCGKVIAESHTSYD